MFNRAWVKYEIYQRLNKSPVTPGFFTSEKVNSAVQEAIDYVGVKMMLADQGFLKKIDYFDIQANQITIPIPSYMEFIEEVRYLVGNVYTPLAYSSEFGTQQWAVTSGATNLPGSYKIVDNNFYFNPPLGVGGTNFLQVEYQRYPSILRNDSEQLDPQLSRAMIYFIIYRSCTILANALGQTVNSWVTTEAMWFDMIQNTIEKRNKQTIPIRDFLGY